MQAESGEEPVRLMARALAHDFNNLIAAIMGHASYIRMIVDPGSEVDQTAATIEAAAERAKDLAAQLYQLGTQLGVRQPFTSVDLHAVIREVVATCTPGSSNTVSLSVRLEADPCTVHGDAGQLNQLLMNLAVNAREAMGPAGGAIAMETKTVERCLHLEVRDTGPGIPAADLDRVFDPLYTSKVDGGGLGLAIVRRIAQNHKAEIEIGANQPTGAIFRFRFPAR